MTCLTIFHAPSDFSGRSPPLDRTASPSEERTPNIRWRPDLFHLTMLTPVAWAGVTYCWVPTIARIAAMSFTVKIARSVS